MGINTTFSARRKSLVVTAVAVAAAGGIAAAVIPAFATGATRADHAGHSGRAGHSGHEGPSGHAGSGQEIVSRDVPVFTWWYQSNIVIARKNVGNIKVDASGDWGFIKNLTRQQ